MLWPVYSCISNEDAHCSSKGFYFSWKWKEVLLFDGERPHLALHNLLRYSPVYVHFWNQVHRNSLNLPIYQINSLNRLYSNEYNVSLYHAHTIDTFRLYTCGRGKWAAPSCTCRPVHYCIVGDTYRSLTNTYSC